MIELQPGGMTWRRTLHGTADQIPHARRFVRFLLADAPCQNDAELIVAEPASNAVLHTDSSKDWGTSIVEVVRTVATVTVAVYDFGGGGVPRIPAPCRASPERGWGLSIVAVVACEVGYDGDDLGHRVWARLRVPS
jgi:anti-sigma regulatory factor (Ser/Thr protein kinase)